MLLNHTYNTTSTEAAPTSLLPFASFFFFHLTYPVGLLSPFSSFSQQVIALWPARQATFDLAINKPDVVGRCRQEILRVVNRSYYGSSKVVSHPLSSRSSGSSFGRHFSRHYGRHVSWAVVTLVITKDSPRTHLGSLVVLVVTLLSFSSLVLNHGDNEYQRVHQCHHMGCHWRHAG